MEATEVFHALESLVAQMKLAYAEDLTLQMIRLWQVNGYLPLVGSCSRPCAVGHVA